MGVKRFWNKDTRPYLVVGVTGGIGSGKTTVCKVFSELGRPVISADEIARKLADENSDAKKGIEIKFGKEAYLQDGRLDRKRMAGIVFRDQGKRKKLDSIIHPLVFKSIEQQLDLLPLSQAAPYVLIEAALIYETGMESSLDHVIVVTANEETNIERVIARDKISRDEVLQRIASQLNQSKKEKFADFVIRNDGQIADLRSSIVFLDSILRQIQSARVS